MLSARLHIFPEPAGRKRRGELCVLDFLHCSVVFFYSQMLVNLVVLARIIGKVCGTLPQGFIWLLM